MIKRWLKHHTTALIKTFKEWEPVPPISKILWHHNMTHQFQTENKKLSKTNNNSSSSNNNLSHHSNTQSSMSIQAERLMKINQSQKLNSVKLVLSQMKTPQCLEIKLPTSYLLDLSSKWIQHPNTRKDYNHLMIPDSHHQRETLVLYLVLAMILTTTKIVKISYLPQRYNRLYRQNLENCQLKKLLVRRKIKR